MHAQRSVLQISDQRQLKSLGDPMRRPASRHCKGHVLHREEGSTLGYTDKLSRQEELGGIVGSWRILG